MESKAGPEGRKEDEERVGGKTTRRRRGAPRLAISSLQRVSGAEFGLWGGPGGPHVDFKGWETVTYRNLRRELPSLTH